MANKTVSNLTELQYIQDLGELSDNYTQIANIDASDTLDETVYGEWNQYSEDLIEAGSFWRDATGGVVDSFIGYECIADHYPSDGISTWIPIDDAEYFTPVSLFADGAGFRPIGTIAAPFTGSYNGQNFEIQSIFIDRSIEACGLFGFSAGTLLNIHIKGVNIKNSLATASNTAAIAGYLRCPATNCYVEGVTDWRTILQDSNANAMHMVGGLFASGDHGVTTSKVSGCHVINMAIENKSVGATSTTGSFCGQSGTIEAMNIGNSCVSNNTTVIGRTVGGFAGVIARASKITNCFSRATPTSNHATGYSGGFCGVFYLAGIEITRCYAQNTPAGTGTLAAFCAWVQTAATVVNSYYEGADTQAGATGLSAENMKIADSFTGWNFNTLWNIDDTETLNDGYPYLDSRAGASGVRSRYSDGERLGMRNRNA